jgi:hypothetical protein
MRVYVQDEDWHREMAAVWGGLRESRKITEQRASDFRRLVYGSLVASWTFAVSPAGMMHARQVLRPTRAGGHISDKALWEWMVGLFQVVMEKIYGNGILADLTRAGALGSSLKNANLCRAVNEIHMRILKCPADTLLLSVRRCRECCAGIASLLVTALAGRCEHSQLAVYADTQSDVSGCAAARGAREQGASDGSPVASQGVLDGDLGSVSMNTGGGITEYRLYSEMCSSPADVLSSIKTRGFALLPVSAIKGLKTCVAGCSATFVETLPYPGFSSSSRKPVGHSSHEFHVHRCNGGSSGRCVFRDCSVAQCMESADNTAVALLERFATHCGTQICPRVVFFGTQKPMHDSVAPWVAMSASGWDLPAGDSYCTFTKQLQSPEMVDNIKASQPLMGMYRSGCDISELIFNFIGYSTRLEFEPNGVATRLTRNPAKTSEVLHPVSFVMSDRPRPDGVVHCDNCLSSMDEDQEVVALL